jgi:hypothetical protein
MSVTHLDRAVPPSKHHPHRVAGQARQTKQVVRCEALCLTHGGARVECECLYGGARVECEGLCLAHDWARVDYERGHRHGTDAEKVFTGREEQVDGRLRNLAQRSRCETRI